MQPINQSEMRNPQAGPSHRPDYSPEQSRPAFRPPRNLQPDVRERVRPSSPVRPNEPNRRPQSQNSQIQTLPNTTSGESFALFPPVIVHDDVPCELNDSFSQTQSSAFHNQILTEAGFQIDRKSKDEKVLFRIHPTKTIRQNPRENC